MEVLGRGTGSVSNICTHKLLLRTLNNVKFAITNTLHWRKSIFIIKKSAFAIVLLFYIALIVCYE